MGWRGKFCGEGEGRGTGCELLKRGQSPTQLWFSDLGISWVNQPGYSGCEQQIPTINHLNKRDI